MFVRVCSCVVRVLSGVLRLFECVLRVLSGVCSGMFVCVQGDVGCCAAI